MASKKPHKSKVGSRSDPISESASDWMGQFVKHFELNFLDACRDLPRDAGAADFHDAAMRAAFETFRDSGMAADAIVESLGQASAKQRVAVVKWNPALNQRRFELIDKEIQETITFAESVELAGLTRIMRDEVDSESNLPLAGAKVLHRKLLELGAADKQ
jgi:hypothetical protein